MSMLTSEGGVCGEMFHRLYMGESMRRFHHLRKWFNLPDYNCNKDCCVVWVTNKSGDSRSRSDRCAEQTHEPDEKHVRTPFVCFNIRLYQIRQASSLVQRKQTANVHWGYVGTIQLPFRPTFVQFVANRPECQNVCLRMDRCVMPEHVFELICQLAKGNYPAILFRNGLVGMIATSSQILLLVSKSNVNRV